MPELYVQRCAPFVASRAKMSLFPVTMYMMPLWTSGVPSAEYLPAMPDPSRCVCQASFSWETFPVVIWFSEEYRWLAMLPPVVIQFAPGSACSWEAVHLGEIEICGAADAPDATTRNASAVTSARADGLRISPLSVRHHGNTKLRRGRRTRSALDSTPPLKFVSRSGPARRSAQFVY